MGVVQDVTTSKQPGFKIDRFTLEIGGRKIGMKQIASVPDSYIAKGDIKYRHNNVLPSGHSDSAIDINNLWHKKTQQKICITPVYIHNNKTDAFV